MIEINLLPPEHRPVERTPLPRLLTIFFGVLLSAAGVVAWLWLSMVVVPKAKDRCSDRKQAMEKVQKVAEEVQKIERELKAAKDREDVLRDIFNQRICWARLVDRLAEARASVKGNSDDVVLTKVELKKASSAAAAAGGRGREVRQLLVQAFVATSRKEASAGDLRETGLAFIKALCGDNTFKQDFECDEGGDKNAKYTYLGDQMSESSSAKDAKDAKDSPKALLSFEVVFTFKSPPAPPAKPAAQPARPPVAAKK